MIRTRDFILVFTTIVFLVAAIGVTVLKPFLHSVGSGERLLEPSSNLVNEYTAQVDSHAELNRADNLQALKEKVRGDKSVIAMPEPEESPASSNEVSEEVIATNVEQKCPYYATQVGMVWNPKNMYWQQSPGFRTLLEKTEAVLPSSATTSSSSIIQSTDVTRVKLVSRALPVNNPSCIDSDVVAVAIDGSLIRNNEVGLYGVFGPETIIGYALDGFPVYGKGTNSLDSCGGRIVGGQYRYELSESRTTIVNCFAGEPATIYYGNARF